ncbi:hypothetical protein CCACVL1_01021 [Corchorus capsularis]|uniref:Uncharacterized protein n=1 Tax=Corchorus capsularis TaxID=210143 RepID=A0A1R3KSH0_COCAP|nr:hypothetical protein CCACVL1_01021 [Corchorus capsularis]
MVLEGTWPSACGARVRRTVVVGLTEIKAPRVRYLIGNHVIFPPLWRARLFRIRLDSSETAAQ